MSGPTKPLAPLSRSAALRPSPAEDARIRFEITVVSGPDAGKTFRSEDRVVVGKEEGVTFQLSDEAVSRRHLEIEPRGDGVRVIDRGSTNGTYLAGARIQQLTIHEEAELTLGTTVLRISIVPADAENLPPLRTSFGRVIGRGPAMQQLFGVLERAAPTDSTVLLLGETGTGKEVIAESIHQASPRRNKPFVVVDCGAVAANLIESELFGHTRGAFSGAVTERKGAFLEADGGTVFLDEIGELPLDLQPRLLRVLESGTVKRLGEDKPRKVDVRIVAATHRDLEQRVRDGTFRQDLYFRLAVVIARIPPLRERPEDIPLLVRHFVAQMGRGDFELPPELRKRLSAHTWPGNVRELRNVIERALAGSDVELGNSPIAGGGRSHVPAPGDDLTGLPFKDAKERLVDAFTREYIVSLLDRCGGNITEVARTAGLARNYVHKLVNKFGLRGHD
ncbi:MAG: sigma 54-dependent Fis family transcriptional regulator [Myxococcaceae bacterium]|nr:sigma 54-dependent Fis family transcriptional regulator [Myxococcaceae bacterium]